MPVRIVEGKLPYTGGTGIEITSDKVINLLLREENNLIMINDDNEVYTDLQLESGLTPSSDFPVGVTVGKVLQTDGWTQSGLILNWKTTSGDYARWIYANDGKLYFDNGTGTWKKVYYSTDVDTLLTNLRNEVYQYFMKWSDFERDTQTGVNVILSLTTETTPTADFTVSAPTTVRTGQEYVLRVNSVDTAYVMTLGTGIVNPKLVNTNLHAHTSDVFVFLALDDGTLELQPVVEPGATANDGVLTIQKNGTTVATFTANQGTNTTANITVPTVVDNLTTQSSTNALSANQGYELKGMIDDLAGFGKFLSLWNATTGMPISFPLATPYTYSTGDYFVVEVVSSATPPVNYRPNGSSYTGTASSTAETDELEVGDVYVYDGSVWLLQSNHGKTVSFGNIAGDPYDNTNLGNALNDKQDVLTAGANITIDPVTNEISANNTTYSSATSTTAGIVKLGSDTAISETIQSPAGATNKTYPVQLNASGQMGVNVPRANTTYGAGTGINIDGNNDIQNTGVLSFNGNTGAVTGVGSVNGNTGAVTVNDVKVAATAPASPTEGMTWYDTTNDQLKVYDGSNWQVTGKEYTAGTGIEIKNGPDYSPMQGPCPSGYHVPSKDEWTAVKTIWTTLGGGNTDGTNFGIALKLPFMGQRNFGSSDVGNHIDGIYWSYSRYNANSAYALHFKPDIINDQEDFRRAYGFAVRSFKNSPVVPDNTWTTLKSGTGSAGIFWSSSLGLISMSGDGITWITIADKNVGATTVWNSGDTLSEANCGGYFQRGNNYIFPFTGALTDTSTTQVDASAYGPGNYYSSNIFIKYNGSWDSSDNGNLRGGVTGVITFDNAITNTGVLSVNGQTGNVTVAGGIQNDTTGTTTTVTAIRAGSENEYNQLQTHSSSVIYHIY